MNNRSKNIRQLLRLEVEDKEVKIAYRAVQLLFMQMGAKVTTNLMFVAIKGVNRLDGNGKQQSQRKNRCKNYLNWFML